MTIKTQESLFTNGPISSVLRFPKSFLIATDYLETSKVVTPRAITLGTESNPFESKATVWKLNILLTSLKYNLYLK